MSVTLSHYVPWEVQGLRGDGEERTRGAGGHPLEEVLLSPCYRQRNCCPERLRHLPNITQQVHSSTRIQTQVPLILSTPHRLLRGQFTPT